MWIWGYKFAYDDYYAEENDNNEEDMYKYKDAWTPAKMDWFEKNGYRVLDFSVGDIFFVCKVVNKTGEESVLGVMHPDYNYQKDRLFGNHKTELLKRSVYRLDNINADQLKSFSCGTYMMMFCNKLEEKCETIIPGREEPSGLTHAYRVGNHWEYLAEDEYEAKKDQLPGLSIAVRAPMSGFEQKSLALTDLNELLDKIGVDEAVE